jgi:hypothetical protein
MIVRLATAHENARVIPLPAKEGRGVLYRDAGVETHYPLPSPPARGGVIFMEGWRPESDPPRMEKGMKMQKRC